MTDLIESTFLPEVIRKSNPLIMAKFGLAQFGMSKLAYDIINFAIGGRLCKDGHQMTAEITSSEIRSLLDANDDTNLYKKLKSVALQLQGNVIFIGDGKNFNSFTFITNVTYTKGHLTIYFNKEMSPYLEGITRNYTKLNLSIMLQLPQYAERLYEILAASIWQLRKTSQDYITVSYGVNELRALLGMIDIQQDYIRKALDQKKDWDTITEMIIAKGKDGKGHQSFTEFRDFNRRVLKPSIKKINDIAPFHVDYNLETGGLGGKVWRICFILREKTEQSIQTSVQKTMTKIDELLPEYRQIELNAYLREEQEAYEEICVYLHQHDISTDGLSEQSFKRIYQAAERNVGIIKDEIDYSQKAGEIENYYGWLMSAVKGRYSQTVKIHTLDGSSKTAEQYDCKQPSLTSKNLQNIWDKIKMNPRFDEFMEQSGMSLIVFEATFDLNVRIELWSNYVQKGMN